MRILGIDYGEARVGIAITDQLNITVQGLETIQRNGSDKVILRRLDEIFEKYEVDTIVVGMPLNMNGTMSERAKITEQFVHKLKCKYNKMEIHTIDERLTTVEAHKTMNFLEVNKNKKKNIKLGTLTFKNTLSENKVYYLKMAVRLNDSTRIYFYTKVQSGSGYH